jgi:hypothetical protein
MPSSWDNKYAWTTGIQANAEAYLAGKATEQAKLIGQLRGGPSYYILSPEFTYIGDAEISPEYDDVVRRHIAILRKYAGDKVRIVRGYFMAQSAFESNLGALVSFIQTHPEQIAACDYFGPAFHGQDAPDELVAQRMVAAFAQIRTVTDRPLFVPYSYIRWDPGDVTDAGAQRFWNYLRDHRTDLIALNLKAWCLAATMEERSDGTGLLQPTSVPANGYPSPLEFSLGGAALVDWMRLEAALQP